MDVNAHRLGPDGDIPNNAALAVLVYTGALAAEAEDLAGSFEALFERHGWSGCWRDGLFAFHHFHSTAHEVLGIYSGTLRAQLGGPRGIEIEVGAGDVIVVPAGVAHRRVAVRGRLGVIGAYPRGQRPDLCEAGSGDPRHRASSVEAVALPAADPVLGRDGPLLVHWRAGAGSTRAR